METRRAPADGAVEGSDGRARPWLDERGCVAIELPCVKCSYSLKGLALTGACPECGTAVGRSVHGAELRFAPLRWLTKVRAGLVATLIAAGLMALVSAYTATVLLLGMWPAIFTLLFFVLAILFGGVGVSLVTAREPGGPLGGDGLRTFTRVAAAIAVVAFIMSNLWFISRYWGAMSVGQPTFTPYLCMISAGFTAGGAMECALRLLHRMPSTGEQVLPRVVSVLCVGWGLLQCFARWKREDLDLRFASTVAAVCLFLAAAGAVYALVCAVRGMSRELKAGAYLRANGVIE